MGQLHAFISRAAGIARLITCILILGAAALLIRFNPNCVYPRILSVNISQHVIEVNAERYMGGGGKGIKRHWNVTCSEFRETDGIPMKSVATWKLPEGDFSWYKFELVDIN